MKHYAHSTAFSNHDADLDYFRKVLIASTGHLRLHIGIPNIRFGLLPSWLRIPVTASIIPMRKHNKVDPPDMVKRLAEKMQDRCRWRLLQGQRQLDCHNLDASPTRKAG
jgi:hypothetical protein